VISMSAFLVASVVLLVWSPVTVAGCYQLTGDSLPSAEGWTYLSNAGDIEEDIFSVSGGILTQNTMGTGFIGSTNYYIEVPPI